MKNNPFKFLLICIAAGIAVGSVIGVLGLLNVFSQESYMFTVKLLIKLCLGVIVGLVDVLCMWGLIIRPLIDERIKNKGIKTKAIIENITALPRPDKYGLDKEFQKARFVYSVRYGANGKSITAQCVPTCLTSRKELDGILPIDEGEEIDIKYLKSFPSDFLIDNDILFKAVKEERRESRIHLIMIPLITTIVFITLLILL